MPTPWLRLPIPDASRPKAMNLIPCLSSPGLTGQLAPQQGGLFPLACRLGKPLSQPALTGLFTSAGFTTEECLA